MLNSAVAQWRAQGRALGLSHTDLELFADAFEHQERAAVRREMR